MSIVSRGVGHDVQRELYSPREVEHLLSISHATLYRLISDGRLPTLKIGARRLVPVSALDALLSGGAAK